MIRAACLLVLTLLLPTGAAAQASPDVHAAVRTGEVARVEEALKAGAALEARDSWGRTPLIVALQQGKAPVVELLLARGADVNATDAWGRTPLLVAAQMRNTAAMRQLIALKADVNAANRNDITPLIASAQMNNVEAVVLLLEARADPNRADNLGWTALMWAASRNRDALVRLLLAGGADAGKTARDGATALELARRGTADPALLTLLESRTPAKPAASVTPAGAAPAAGAASAAGRAAVPPRAGAAAPPATVSPAFDPGRVVRGNVDAPLTVFEFTDFQCPYCAFGAKVMDGVLARYEGQVRLVVKHLPLPLIHPMAVPAAHYFEAVAMQDPAKAWAFYDAVFRNQAALSGGEAWLRKVAADVGADPKRLEDDLRSGTPAARVAADLKESEKYRFDGVPVFVVNGRVVAGAQPEQVFADLIDALLRP